MKKTLLIMAAFVAAATSAFAQTELLTGDAITGIETYFATGAGWTADGESSAVWDGTKIDVNIALPKENQWQAQVKVVTNITSFDPDKQYDFSCKIVSNKAFGGVTVKIMDNLPVIMTSTESLVEGENILSFKNYDGQAGAPNGVIVFDFGYAPAETALTISEMSLIEHDPVAPAVVEADWNYDSASNMWKAVDEGSALSTVWMFFANSSWGGIDNAEYTVEGNTWNITLPEGLGVNQWQGQFAIKTTLAAEAAKEYNFYCIMEADNDCPGVTIKFTQDGDDNNFFFDGRHKIKAGEPFVYKAVKASLRNDAPQLNLFLDFGGTPGGTKVKVSSIYFEEDGATGIKSIADTKAGSKVYSINGMLMNSNNLPKGMYIIDGKKMVK